jgi:hypothetical protein
MSRRASTNKEARDRCDEANEERMDSGLSGRPERTGLRRLGQGTHQTSIKTRHSMIRPNCEKSPVHSSWLRWYVRVRLRN